MGLNLSCPCPTLQLSSESLSMRNTIDYFLLWSRYPGFCMLKLRAKGGMPVAFADFEVSPTPYMNSSLLNSGILQF